MLTRDLFRLIIRIFWDERRRHVHGSKIVTATPMTRGPDRWVRVSPYHSDMRGAHNVCCHRGPDVVVTTRGEG